MILSDGCLVYFFTSNEMIGRASTYDTDGGNAEATSIHLVVIYRNRMKSNSELLGHQKWDSNESTTITKLRARTPQILGVYVFASTT
jgi:hypothetical protein